MSKEINITIDGGEKYILEILTLKIQKISTEAEQLKRENDNLRKQLKEAEVIIEKYKAIIETFASRVQDMKNKLSEIAAITHQPSRLNDNNKH